MSSTNPTERMMKILQADPEKLAEIDRILDGQASAKADPTTGPLLLGMSAGAKYTGVSRPTFWRMVKANKIQKVEILPGSFRVRRADIEALVAGKAVSNG